MSETGSSAIGGAQALPEGNPDEVAPVRPGEDLNWPAIEALLRTELPELNGPFSVLQFPNGSANLTYLLRFGELELVLRRPPFGTIAPGAHDMRREHRVLSKLWRHFDKAPRSYLFCEDHSVAGADFFVMERRVGEVVRVAIPDSMIHHERAAHRMGLALVDAMAEMHLLDPAACDLGDLGKAEGFVARQVKGWKHRWDLVKGESPLALMDSLAERLEASMPVSRVESSFVHNDLKLDNCQFTASDPDRVHSIFDWDMTTLGDPLIDLGTLLNYWPDPSDVPGTRRPAQEALAGLGLPTRAEVVERYAQQTGFDCTAAAWYEAFAQWKTAVVVRQLHHRWLMGDSHDPRMETIADSVPLLAAIADQLLEGLGV